MSDDVREAARHLQEKLDKISTLYRDRYPRWTNEDAIAVHILLADLESKDNREASHDPNL